MGIPIPEEETVLVEAKPACPTCGHPYEPCGGEFHDTETGACYDYVMENPPDYDPC